jgi:hypothetical protein
MVRLTDSPRPVTITQARRLVAQHDGYFAFSIPLGGGREHTFDVGRRTVQRLLSRVADRHERVPLAELFGTLVLGGLA